MSLMHRTENPSAHVTQFISLCLQSPRSLCQGCARLGLGMELSGQDNT